MVESSTSPTSFPLKRLVIIAAVVGVAAIGFAYTAGWLSPHRLTPKKMVAALAPPGGPALGHRRNHAKGICFTGTFAANGDGSALSTAQVFARGQYPVVGRFNLATADPHVADAMVRVRGIGISITTPDGQEWRSAMIDAPIFAASTPQAFYQLLTASGSKDPNAMKKFIAANPEFLNFAGWAKNAPWTASYAEERYNSLDSFCSSTGLVRSIQSAGRWFQRRNPSPSRRRSWLNAALIFLNRRSPSASLPALNAGVLCSPLPTLMTQPRTPPRPGPRIAALSMSAL
jgi:catalase